MPGGHPSHKGNRPGYRQRSQFQKPAPLKRLKAGFENRLYVKGVFTSFRRGLRNQDCNTALLKLENVNDKSEVPYYVGKKVAYIFRAPKNKLGETKRVIWGKVTTAHGNSGAVRAQFKSNLPSQAIGSRVRVMLFPSKQ